MKNRYYNILSSVCICFTVIITLSSCQQKESNKHKYNESYSKDYLNRVAFPIGGIGAGMYCMEGTGYFSHMSVRNRPEIFHEPGMFATLYVKGIENGAKVLEGQVPERHKFGKVRAPGASESALGGSGGSGYGLPRFTDASFTARFPFGIVNLKDEDMPVTVTIKGWSPFIPTDADNSSLPVGIIEYTLENESNESLETVFSFHSKNFMWVWGRGVQSIKPMKNGFVLSQTGTPEEPFFQGEFAIFTDQPNTVVNHCWFRGRWFDALTHTWKRIESGDITPVEPIESNAPGASLAVPVELAPGESKTIKIFTAWYAPYTNLRIGGNDPVDNTESEIVYTGDEYPTHRPWYSSKFSNINEVVNYISENYDELYGKTKAFTDAFYSSTLPSEVIEAIAANLTILKSPTVLRQYDGRLWAWEGCADEAGSCHGSCTHVWNYAQAIPHLFPSLERSLRETEFGENQDTTGHQSFRAHLPIRPVNHNFYAAADGQLGGIMKLYRDWRISGDNSWLKKMYPKAKSSIDYCIRTWDPKKEGVMKEPHHNTYDIEFWGANGMISSFYMGALQAIITMGDFLGENTEMYKELYSSGRKYTEEKLFNGEYFIQDIQWTGLDAEDPLEAAKHSLGGAYSPEAAVLLDKEGPKYQYGSGCLSDGVFGSLLSRMCGLPEPLDVEKTKSHILSVHKYNLRDNMEKHANPSRPAFAYGSDGGLVTCTWPKGGKPTLPFIYSDEVWTGIEYQVASHLMLMDEVEKGLDIVRTCRNRYDGRIRNPFNEYECGNWYARALSSYGMIQGLTGVRYDAVDKTLYIDSKIGDFTCFISTDTGFGTVTVKKGKPAIKVFHGNIDIDQYNISGEKFTL